MDKVTKWAQSQLWFANSPNFKVEKCFHDFGIVSGVDFDKFKNSEDCKKTIAYTESLVH